MFTQGFTIHSSNLNLLQIKETGIIRSLKSTNQRIIHQLQELGLTIGLTITLEQKFPDFVIQTEQTRLRLTPDLAKAIYVRLVD